MCLGLCLACCELIVDNILRVPKISLHLLYDAYIILYETIDLISWKRMKQQILLRGDKSNVFSVDKQYHVKPCIDTCGCHWVIHYWELTK